MKISTCIFKRILKTKRERQRREERRKNYKRQQQQQQYNNNVKEKLIYRGRLSKITKRELKRKLKKINRNELLLSRICFTLLFIVCYCCRFFFFFF